MTSPAMTAVLPDWRALWRAAESAVRPGDDDPRYVFEPIGLMLQPPGQPLPLAYDATPRGSITFATTGGDGVHFSAVQGTYGLIIVMTVPMRFDRPNIVVGTTLAEFLGLGCRHGYFRLEQLAYSYAATSAELARPSPGLDEDQERCLAHIRGHLALTPWPDPHRRLEELQPLLPVAG